MIPRQVSGVIRMIEHGLVVHVEDHGDQRGLEAPVSEVRALAAVMVVVPIDGLDPLVPALDELLELRRALVGRRDDDLCQPGVDLRELALIGGGPRGAVGDRHTVEHGVLPRMSDELDGASEVRLGHAQRHQEGEQGQRFVHNREVEAAVHGTHVVGELHAGQRGLHHLQHIEHLGHARPHLPWRVAPAVALDDQGRGVCPQVARAADPPLVTGDRGERRTIIVDHRLFEGNTPVEVVPIASKISIHCNPLKSGNDAFFAFDDFSGRVDPLDRFYPVLVDSDEQFFDGAVRHRMHEGSHECTHEGSGLNTVRLSLKIKIKSLPYLRNWWPICR